MASNRYSSLITITQDISDKSLDNLKIFADHFEIVDGDGDAIADNYYQLAQQIKEDFSQNFHFNQSLVHIEEEQAQELTLFEENHEKKSDQADNDDFNIPEVILSQRLSQLSTATSTSTTKATLTDSPPQKKKRFQPERDNSEAEDRMPYYLLIENKKFFDQMMEQNVDTTLEKEEVRQLAYLIHYRAYYEQLYHLWSVYLQSGTGKLTENESNLIHRRYWPMHVKLVHKKSGIPLPANATKENEHQAYKNVVSQRIVDYETKMESYQQQVDNKKHSLKERLTWTIEQVIEKFVQQYGIVPLRMKCELTLNMLHCDYDYNLLLHDYEQEKPTTYQRQMFERIYDTQFRFESMKDIYLAHRQRILYDRPLISYDALEISLPFYFTSLTDPALCQQSRDDYEKLIQQTKTNLMAVRLAAIEGNLYQCEQIYQQEKHQMMENHQRQVIDKEMTSVLFRLIEQRGNIMIKKLQLRRHYLFNYYLRSPYGQFEDVTKGKVNHSHRIGFLSNLIVDSTVTTKLSHRQRQLLNRGPTYVAPCQMQVATSFQSIDTVVAKQYAPLQHQLAIVFNKYKNNPLEAFDIPKKIKEEFRDLFSTMIPKIVCERAITEQKLIQSLQYQLKQDHLVLRRTADQDNTFYLMNKNSFEEKCRNYMKQTEDHYEILFTVDDTNQAHIRSELGKRVNEFKNELDKYLKGNKNTDKLPSKLSLKPTEMKLPYLYFLPDSSTLDHERQISVQPMFSSYGSLTWKLAEFLYQILDPFVTTITKRTTIVDDSDFLNKLHHYCHNEKRLHPATLFASIQITNFYTTFSTEREHISGLVGTFFGENPQINKPETISVSTIKNLIELFVKNNLFYYDGKIYRFRRGAPNSMHLSELLSNVYVSLWQKTLFDDARLKTELFVRYNGQIFFTWNHAESDLITFLNTIKKEYQRNFQINFAIGRSVDYLNLHLENRSGQLYTRVYHPTKRALRALPYVVGHAKNKYRHWFRSALVRAVQFSTNYQDFDQERIFLEMSCLLSGYSIDFIENELKKFYHSFDIDTFRFDMNGTVYEILRRRLIDFIDVQYRNATKDKELQDQDRLIHLYYLYDYGPYRRFKEKFTEIWDKFIKTHSKLKPNNIKIILNAKHIFSLNTLLSDQKPSCALLL